MCLSSLLYGLEDPHIAGAAAKIPRESFLYLFQRGRWVFVQQMMRRENHARCADPTLRSAVLEKALLNRVQTTLR